MKFLKKQQNNEENKKEKSILNQIKSKQYKEIKIENPQIVLLYIEEFSMKIDAIMRRFSFDFREEERKNYGSTTKYIKSSW